ncbi:hypothetical protein H5410_017724 [Solanum commersonii]|uniref:Uncharacterized protein n=1 Tax=Solanum commersonii TaxID=4109 RepID=A0A9J6A161_SOLCO|nr:hypothetical protein H5410_017724 [Solanum commersonii]
MNEANSSNARLNYFHFALLSHPSFYFHCSLFLTLRRIRATDNSARIINVHRLPPSFLLKKLVASSDLGGSLFWSAI